MTTIQFVIQHYEYRSYNCEGAIAIRNPEVVVVTIGPSIAQEQLPTALALGADRSILVGIYEEQSSLIGYPRAPSPPGGIIAINKDEEAPIILVAGCGLVADLFEGVLELTGLRHGQAGRCQCRAPGARL